MAASMPSICHAFSSMKASIASDARQAWLRFVLLASVSKRSFVAWLSRTVKVVLLAMVVGYPVVVPHHHTSSALGSNPCRQLQGRTVDRPEPHERGDAEEAASAGNLLPAPDGAILVDHEPLAWTSDPSSAPSPSIGARDEPVVRPGGPDGGRDGRLGRSRPPRVRRLRWVWRQRSQGRCRHVLVRVRVCRSRDAARGTACSIISFSSKLPGRLSAPRWALPQPGSRSSQAPHPWLTSDRPRLRVLASTRPLAAG